MDNAGERTISTKFTYIVTFLLGLAFSITLVQSAWKTAIERKRSDFHFEILSIQQAVARNVLTGNDVTNNVAAFMSSNDAVLPDQFHSFATDILERYDHIEAINYYSFTGDDWVNEFRLTYQIAREGINPTVAGIDIYSDDKYRDAIDTSIATSSVVPAPPDVDNNPDRKYWLFKATYHEIDSLSIKKKNYSGVVQGMVSVLVSPTRLLGGKGAHSSLTITMFSDTSNLYGRQLLYFNEPTREDNGEFLKVDTLTEEELIHLPPYSIKIIIEKDLFLSELEYHLLLVAVLIGFGILMLLYGLASAKAKQEQELKDRNKVIEKKVEEQTYELAVARDEALEAARMKSEFLASMSHEIRTPLNAIIGMSDLMSETSLSKEQSRYVGVFKKAGDALLSLVNDILDLSKMEADQLVLEEIPFDIGDLLEEAAEIYALKAADKDIEIITRIDTDLNLLRIGDPGRLKQIILNLISNALKFTEQGEIVISIYKESQNADILISVADTGIGISKDKLDSIFASFTQADASTTRKYGGTGLGLTISKHLTGMMDGTIWVESEENEGSCFFVRIALPEQESRIKIEKTFSNKKIFIIDSNRSSCDSLEEQLIVYGAQCHKINNTSMLQELIKSEKDCDILLVESRLFFTENGTSDLFSGTDLYRKIILLANPKDISKHTKLAKAKGINKLLIKPIKRKELVQDIDSILSPAEDKRVVEHADKTDEHEQRAKHILLVEDNPDNRLLVKAYLKKTVHTIDEAENGAIAVEQYKQNDYDLVFMDVQMPEMDGHEATRQIRAWEKQQNKKRTPIVSLTAHAIKEEVDKCMAAGCDKHITKPVKKATLLQTIDELG